MYVLNQSACASLPVPAFLLAAQGELIDRVEHHVGAAVEYIEDGGDKLSTAHKYLRKARKVRLPSLYPVCSALSVARNIALPPNNNRPALFVNDTDIGLWRYRVCVLWNNAPNIFISILSYHDAGAVKNKWFNDKKLRKVSNFFTFFFLFNFDSFCIVEFCTSSNLLLHPWITVSPESLANIAAGTPFWDATPNS